MMTQVLRGSFLQGGPRSVSFAIALPATHPARFYSAKSKIHATSGAVRKAASISSSTKSPLCRLSTTNLIRNICLGSVFSSPRLYKLGISGLSWIANSKTVFLNPDKNLLLRWVLRPLLYNHFCAGVNAKEVRKTVLDMKAMGYAGVILCYGREVAASPSTSAGTKHSVKSEAHAYSLIQQWKAHNLETLKMIGANDYIALKFTGAGPSVTTALAVGGGIPRDFLHAVDDICMQAINQGSRIWIDGEQQDLQSTIDTWTIDLMRRYNKDGQALIFNTIQAYLKDAPNVVAHHLELAQNEGWSLGIKLVRGAYIASEVRTRIHDTKAQTDECYNNIVKDLLTESFPGFDKMKQPDIHLFLAGHNNDSIRQASDLVSELCFSGKKPNPVGFGQLQGMADDISCELLQRAEQAEQGVGPSKVGEAHKDAAPRVYKYMTWGTVQECMQYLVRRAVENEGATDRLKGSLPGMKAELRRRLMLF